MSEGAEISLGTGLVCPESKLPLVERSLTEAMDLMAEGRPLECRQAGIRPAVGPTPTVLVRKDLRRAYPVVDGIPVLLASEMLVPWGADISVNLADEIFAEAYGDMSFYNSVAEREASRKGDFDIERTLSTIRSLGPARLRQFPEPRDVWLDAVYESAAQYDCYRHLVPIGGTRLLQLGGKASHVFKFLLAGADRGVVMSPMLSEMVYSLECARRLGLERKLTCVVALAEQIPFPDESFNRIYSGGCVHHMVTSIAFRECARIMAPGGRFAACEPWRAPLYGIGTRVFGKREPEVHCRPLDSRRLGTYTSDFDQASTVHHGALTRYPLLALMKMGISLGLNTVWRINRADDVVSSWIPGVRRFGSSIALLAARGDRAGSGARNGSAPSASGAAPTCTGA